MGVSTLGDAPSFFGLTSIIPPLDSMLDFDTDVKKRPIFFQIFVPKAFRTDCVLSFVV